MVDQQRSRVLLFFSVFQINLRLILVSGKTKEFLFSPNDSAADIAKHVYDNWPMGKPWQSHRRHLLKL